MSSSPTFSGLVAKPVHWLAFGFGSGLSPKAPGTAGTVVAIPLYLLLAMLPLGWYLLALVVTFIVGVYLCDKTSKDMGVHDHPGIVWDEFVGYWITMIAAPAGWLWVLLGFVFFRIFDVLKPWPIRWLDEHVHGGFGIMIDDVLAGVMALACMNVCYWWWL
ncbi:phosphatidylglycerophosphatase A family protein [Pseudomaricurvus sp.]|uniref:phosphatidylglycerophosphatase A family protein n=1 Tax=Pseudomaricurvus sp. TaxID=2004510 RepID=UPI003F6A9DB0